MDKSIFKSNDFVESGNWNVAGDYSRLKIMKPLYLADEYEKIAKFGFSDLFTELLIYFDNFDKNFLKIKGFENLVDTLILIINNSRFAIKIKEDREQLDKFLKRLEEIDELKETLYNYSINQKSNSKKYNIIEENYKQVLKILSKIKGDINEPLNRANLIFINRESFDPIEFKRAIKERMINRG